MEHDETSPDDGTKGDAKEKHQKVGVSLGGSHRLAVRCSQQVKKEKGEVEPKEGVDDDKINAQWKLI
ncbi:hypothetical protein TYRP_008751 [Tyrophagus putrescentiae]|nr:hypothetical protein TYRP_008751 [Tyrophagus putrescentiae]